MNEEELKRIHGDDVELKPDDSQDDKLKEADALAEAASQGIYFKDTFYVVKADNIMTLNVDPSNGHEKYEDAKAELESLEDKDQYTIMTKREQLQQDTQKDQ